LSQELGKDGKENHVDVEALGHREVLDDLWLNQLFGLIGFIMGE
jgi:hypothetical protein